MALNDFLALVELVSVGLFIVGLKRLSRVRTARSGNTLAAVAMLIAVVATLIEEGRIDYRWILSGIVIGGAIGIVTVAKAKATEMPEIVARFNGFGGAASAFVAMALFWLKVVQAETGQTAAEILGGAPAFTIGLSILIGGATFSGSVMAELKLRGTVSGTPRVPARPLVMGTLLIGGLAIGTWATFAVGDAGVAEIGLYVLLLASILIGIVLVLPIGGADMPVVISLLNSLSGLAAATTGFALDNNLLIVAGTIVGFAGLILTQVMCKAMNRSLINVLVGGFGGDTVGDTSEYEGVVSSSAEEAAMVLEVARSVIIVPGYGLAAARAQHTAYEFAKALAARGAEVKFAIHPVAGRMPGHMNVVLAEADVPYDQLVEMDDINHEFSNTDVVIVVGANDVVNPAAKTQPSSPIAGMPILNVEDAARVFIIKRSLSPGYAGIKNELFERPNACMIYGDAKEVLNELTKELAGAPV